MKIALIGPTYPYKGGIAHLTTLFYKALSKSQQVSFFSFSRPYPKSIFPGNTINDPSKMILKPQNVLHTIDWANPATWTKTAQSIIKINPDLLILKWWTIFWFLPFYVICQIARKKKNITVIAICHNIYDHEASRFNKMLSKSFLKLPHLLVVHSQDDRKILAQWFNPESIILSFLPIYSLNESDSPYSKTEAKKMLNVQGKVVLFFGFIRPYKGLHYLINAVCKIKQQQPVTLLIAGESWKDKKSYLTLIQQGGIQDTTLWIDRYISNEETSLLFSAADVVALPYTHATGSGVASLCLAYKRPLVTTSVGNLINFEKYHSICRIVPPGDSDALSQALLDMLENPGAVSSEEYARVQEEYSWDNYLRLLPLSGKGCFRV